MKCVIYLISFVLCASYQADTRTSRSLSLSSSGRSSLKGEQKKRTKIINYKKPLCCDRFLWISDDVILSQQKGVYRVNCIDCLDRTNVVQASNIIHLTRFVGSQTMQSAFARHVLNRQLLALAFLNPSEHHRTEMDVVFNDGTTQGCAVVRLSGY